MRYLQELNNAKTIHNYENQNIDFKKQKEEIDKQIERIQAKIQDMK